MNTPNISFSINSHPTINTRLTVTSLLNVLDYCKNIPSNAAKGTTGCMFAFDSLKFPETRSNHKSNGVIFVDIDNISSEADNIYGHFNELCELVPNIIAMNFSYSHNLHIFLYDPSIVMEDATDKYRELSSLWLCVIAKAIKTKLGIDLRDIEGSMDRHNTSIRQRFYLNHTEYKYNTYFCASQLTPAQVTKIKHEYPMMFKTNDLSTIHKSNKVVRTGHIFDAEQYSGIEKIVVDKNFYILNYNGYEARTFISSAAYYHFGQDINTTESYLNTIYVYTPEWRNQLYNMIDNNTIGNMYRGEFEKYLFSNENEILLEPNQYISDIFNLDDYNDRFIYIQSNTNTGKTEFIKKYMLAHDNSYIIQMNKALRDGKSQGVEDFTFQNWDQISSSRIHTTLDGLIHNQYNIDIENATIFVDETHLLQDYFGMYGRYVVITELLSLLSKAKRVVFLSATPKQDINLFKFKTFKFTKKQPQSIRVIRKPINYEDKKGSKENAKYSYIIKIVNKLAQKGEKTIIFSDQKQEAYKKYGLAEQDNVTYFNANNLNDENVQAILKQNKLNNPITLATRYLGVGVEIKHEDKVNIVFCLDEGFNVDFIEQSLGRPRDAKKIDAYFFYTNNELRKQAIDDDKLQLVQSCFTNLIIENEYGENCLNLIAAKGINLFDDNFNTRDDQNKIKTLKVGNILDSYRNIGATSLDVLTSLPYKQIDIINCEPENLQVYGKKVIHRKETKLQDYLLSLNPMQIAKLFELRSYEDILKVVPYDDKTNARKYLEVCRQINRYNIDLSAAIEYFDNISTAGKIISMLRNYVQITTGSVVLQSIEGLEKTEADINKECDIVEKVFTPNFLSKLTSKVKSININLPSIFTEVLNEIEAEDKIFNNDNYKKISKSIAQSTNTNSAKSITIQNKQSQQVYTFNTKGECQKFLKVNNTPFSKFIKGESTKLDKEWTIL